MSYRINGNMYAGFKRKTKTNKKTADNFQPYRGYLMIN